jgi:serine/threonine protein kinase
MKKLNHPCLMKVYEIIESDSSFYLILDYYEKGSLIQVLEGWKKSLKPITQVKEIMKDLLF